MPAPATITGKRRQPRCQEHEVAELGREPHPRRPKYGEEHSGAGGQRRQQHAEQPRLSEWPRPAELGARHKRGGGRWIHPELSMMNELQIG
jgi:hypothetical protein